MNAPLPQIYLAGPDIFRPDATQRFAELSQLCRVFGMQALLPIDVGTFVGDTARRSIESCMQRLQHEADGMIANLQPFRGAEPDSRTVFEVGVAVARGLPVVAYNAVGAYAERVRAVMPVRFDAHGVLRDDDGWEIEDGGWALNSMLALSVRCRTTPADALRILAQSLSA